MELEGIKFNYFKPLRNGQYIRIKREFDLSGLRNRVFFLLYYRLRRATDIMFKLDMNMNNRKHKK